MRVSREQAETNRQRVIETAARLFRENGIDAVSVAELMSAAGLTHGGFYGQFKSKDDLAKQAASQALEETAETRSRLTGSREERWALLKKNYLSATHCEHPGYGCPFTTLSIDASRRNTDLKQTLTRGLKLFLKDIQDLMSGRGPDAKRRQAMVALSAMVGAMVLARAVDDDKLAADLREAVQSSI